MRTHVIATLVGSTLAVAAPKGSLDLDFGHGQRWSVIAPGAKHASGKYEHRVVAKTWAIVVQAWPTSTVFIQTLDEQLAAMRKRKPDLVVMQAEQRSKSDWVLVVEDAGVVTGVVLRPGRGDNAMCTFDAGPRGWKEPLAACRSLERRGRPRIS